MSGSIDKVDKKLEYLEGSVELEKQESLFANIDLEPDIFGVQQVVKEAMDIAPELSPEEIEKEDRQRKARGSKAVQFEKHNKGIRVEVDRGWSLTPASVSGTDIISDLQGIRNARFLQSVASLFAFAVRRGSFRINAKITERTKEMDGFFR